MQKSLLIIFFLFITLYTYAEKKDDDIVSMRIKIGPTISSPVEYNDKLYFLATTGILYESNKKLNELKNIYQIEKSSVSGISVYDNIAYFGEGLHNDNKINLYAFDLAKKKLKFKISVEGHIEKEPVLKDGILYVSLGPKGLGALDITTQKFIWIIDKIGTNKIHIDSTPVFYGESVCVGSIYEFKGIVCLNRKTGMVEFSQTLTFSAKSELALNGDRLFAFSTEANFVNSKWNTPSHFFVVDLKNKKLIKEVDLRGFNFFAPVLTIDDEARRELRVTITSIDTKKIELRNKRKKR